MARAVGGAQAQWEPIAFELAFGLPRDRANDPRSVEAEVTLPEGYRLRGIVDLVERQRDGTDLRVTDYKTGRDWTQRNLVVGGGEMLQPVLYGLAVEQLFGAPRGRVAALLLHARRRLLGARRVDAPEARGPRPRGAGHHRSRHRGRLPARRAATAGLQHLRLPRRVRPARGEADRARRTRARLEPLRALREWP